MAKKSNNQAKKKTTKKKISKSKIDKKTSKKSSKNNSINASMDDSLDISKNSIDLNEEVINKNQLTLKESNSKRINENGEYVALYTFYRANASNGFFSNLFLREIEFEGMKFKCSEYAYQYGKYRNEKESEINTLKWVMEAPIPSLVAQISHNLFAWQIVKGWNDIKVQRMRDVLRAKFIQHEDLKKLLLDTGNGIIEERSNMDKFWGRNKNGEGKNMLGELLMELREELKEDVK